MKYDYHVVVIGAGSAGLYAAYTSATLGAKVALIEGNQMGGDCLNTGCVPSKAFIRCARIAKDIRRAKRYGVYANMDPDIAQVMKRVHQVIHTIEPHDSARKYEKAGVDVIHGMATFIDKHHIQAGTHTLSGQHFIICTGSKPRIPQIHGLHYMPYYTHENIFEMREMPEHLIVLGAGQIGLEMGQAFQLLGAKVTCIDQVSHLFTHDDVEVAPLMKHRLEKDGMHFRLNAVIQQVHRADHRIHVQLTIDHQNITMRGDALLVALGRCPNTDDLNLERVGIRTDEMGYIQVNRHMQTSINNIYACGDVINQYQFTPTAGYHANIAIKNIIFHLGTKAQYTAVPWVTYTQPEVAHIGHTEQSARKSGVYGTHILYNIGDNDRAIINGETDGFIKIILDRRNRIIGTTIVSEHAGEMISLATMAIRNRMKYSALYQMLYPYPTVSEIYLYAALQKMEASIQPWHKKMIKGLFLRG